MQTCRRCGRDFDNPIPEVHYQDGSKEIACVEWCANCNAYVMSMIFRDISAYRPVAKGLLQSPQINIPDEVIDAIRNPKCNICNCGKRAWVWNGTESVCWDCCDRERDFEAGYWYYDDRTLPLETKYDRFGQRLEATVQEKKVIKYLRALEAPKS